MELPDLITLMTERRVLRVSTREFQVELHPSAFAPVPAPAHNKTPEHDSELCACGHDAIGEHSTDGCLRGCTVGLCALTTTGPGADA